MLSQKTSSSDLIQDLEILHGCLLKRLLWINEEIRNCRKLDDASKRLRFTEYRKETDKLLSRVTVAISKEPDNQELYEELSLLYKSAILI